MKVNELRIGNYLFLPGYDIYIRVSSIFLSHFRCSGLDGIDYEDSIRKNYEPIPLTPEILERCGFENKSQTTDYYFKQTGHGGWEIIIGGPQKRMHPCVHGESGLEAFGDEVKYLHQLQNLYYALTGEELEINL